LVKSVEEGRGGRRRSTSPEVQLTPKMRLGTLKLYLDCDSHKLLLDRKGTNVFEHASWLVLMLAMAAFIGFIVWLVVYMSTRDNALSQLARRIKSEEFELV
jgi:hypothetical protein